MSASANSGFSTYGSAGDPVQACPLVWIEIRLVDEEDQPVANEAYRIELPDGTVREGTLDEDGRARVEGIPRGNCGITFPELDEAAWDRK